VVVQQTYDEVVLAVGQLWVDVNKPIDHSPYVYEITGLTGSTVYYIVNGMGPFASSRIQWTLDVTLGRLVLGERPNEPGKKVRILA
jgi:hypothetical protein